MENNLENIPIIIPAYEPDGRLLDLLYDFEKSNINNVIIVDDGSGDKYRDIFDKAKEILDRIGGVILVHKVNRGKGRALKTAFEYALLNQPDMIGAVTADSDGQHTVSCINKVKLCLFNNKESLVLGARSFEGKDIPWKSRFGNNLTPKVLKLVSGIDIKDTQTGLRGIPKSLMEKLLSVPGERFEFETRMLLFSGKDYSIVQVPIETIYDSKENHQTHFNPIVDSLKIYGIFFERFIRYFISATSSFLLDIVVFSVLCYFFKKADIKLYILYATVIARIVSSVYNYLLNYLFVFKSKERGLYALLKYYALAIVQLSLSAGLVSLFVRILSGKNETLVKIVVDTVLFLISYQIQKRIVFNKKRDYNEK